MAINYTPEQWRAITSDGHDILVSAGAGSGKTAVLSARVIRKLKEGVPLENLVILTFTKKAAQEMKARIRRAIEKEADLGDAVESVDVADIKTFDAFALSLLQQYGHVMNISSAVNILDSTDAAMLKKTVGDSVMDSFYEIRPDKYRAMVKRLSGKDDSRLRSQLIHFYDALMYFEAPENFLHSMESEYFTREMFETLFSNYESIIFEKVALIESSLNALNQIPFEHEASKKYVDDLNQALIPLLNAEDYDELSKRVHTFKMPTLPRKKDPLLKEEKAMIEAYRDQSVKPLLEELTGKGDKLGDVADSKETHAKAFFQTEADAMTLINLLKMFEERYMAEQMKKETFDYGSVARLVLKIIRSHSSLRDEIKDGINEIMVDEYQDTNALQEQFLSEIKRDNLYMVGDVKQSIYRFRNADPSIFSRKYTTFKNDPSKGEVIDLNANFRSRKEVLEGINTIFAPMMDATIGGIDYDEKQSLSAGNQSFESVKDASNPNGLTIHVYEKEAYESMFKGTLSHNEIELLHIAKDIKKKVNRGMRLKKDDTLEQATYGDFTVLIDRASKFEDARRIFAYVGVPLTVHKSPDFTVHDEIMVMRQLLTLVVALDDKTIYEAYFRHAFMSVVRSFISDSEDDDAVKQVLDFPKTYPGKDELLGMVHGPFSTMFASLKALSHLKRVAPIDETVSCAYEWFNVYEKTARKSDTASMIERLDKLLDLAKQKASQGMNLKTFIQYFQQVVEDDTITLDTQSADIFETNKVNIMTIHKSKGLEFPVVYMPHLGNGFIFRDMNNMRLREDLGILIPHEYDGLDKHFLYRLATTLDITDVISERLRLFYVAMTRAVEQLHLVYQDDEAALMPRRDDTNRVNKAFRRRLKSFEDVIGALKDSLKGRSKTIGLASFEDDTEYIKHLQTDASLTPGTKKKTYEAQPETPAPIKEQSFSSGIDTWIDAETHNTLARGNWLHDALENLDFFEPIEPQLALFNMEESDKDKIRAFFESDIFSRFNYRKVYKEYPFAYKDDEGQKTGFIDLLLETDDAFIIIDYKLKNIDKPEYKAQIEGYANMIASMTKKPVHGYLYSLLDERFKQIL